MWYHYGMKTSYNLRMEKDLKKDLEQMAQEEGRSLNNMIVHILCGYVAERIVKRYRKEKEDVGTK